MRSVCDKTAFPRFVRQPSAIVFVHPLKNSRQCPSAIGGLVQLTCIIEALATLVQVNQGRRSHSFNGPLHCQSCSLRVKTLGRCLCSEECIFEIALPCLLKGLLFVDGSQRNVEDPLRETRRILGVVTSTRHGTTYRARLIIVVLKSSDTRSHVGQRNDPKFRKIQ